MQVTPNWRYKIIHHSVWCGLNNERSFHVLNVTYDSATQVLNCGNVCWKHNKLVLESVKHFGRFGRLCLLAEEILGYVKTATWRGAFPSQEGCAQVKCSRIFLKPSFIQCHFLQRQWVFICVILINGVFFERLLNHFFLFWPLGLIV